MNTPHFGPPFPLKPEDVTDVGWAIVFHTDEDEAVKKSLAPLVEHRRRQINNDKIVKVLEYRTGEGMAEWLARHGVTAGGVRPSIVPYYVLLVGSPERIPFLFGHLLAVEYAVGRLHFDTADEYAAYVASLIDYETSQSVPNSKDAVFFAPRHHFDRATQLSADTLVDPLADGTTPDDLPKISEFGFRTRKLRKNAAKKSALMELLGAPAGSKLPAMLFTASHGIEFPNGDPQQLKHQGALVCQDWPGFGSISPDHYFSGSDVPKDGRMQGMIMFHFACYGAGTPAYNRFFHEQGSTAQTIAPYPFISTLPKTLLAHPNGGALACIGHIERAWGCSITHPIAGDQLLPFANAITRILAGQPVGHALKDFNERYASLSATLAAKLEDPLNNPISEEDLALHWLERNDAESYSVIGDPAVQLRVNLME
jgi:hypothetical protein